MEAGKNRKYVEPGDLQQEISNCLGKTQDDYNKEVTYNEVILASKQLMNTSTGVDDIHNILIKALSPQILSELVDLFNYSFKKGIVPTQWKEGVIIPIIKPNKNKSILRSYRPITLLSCLGKLLDRVATKRLEYFIENKYALSKSQCGYRKGKGSTDVLLRLEDQIRRAQHSGGVCLVIYIDLEGAFDKIWHMGQDWKKWYRW